MRSSNECCSPLSPDQEAVAFDTGGSPLALSSPTPPSVPPIRLYSTRRPKRHRPQQPNHAMQTAASALDGELSGRKPVIYPYPPSSFPDVTAGLQLTPSRRRPPSRLANNIPRNPSPGRSQQSPAACLSTRPLALKCLTCIGRRCKALFNDFLVVILRLIPSFLPTLSTWPSSANTQLVAEHISRNHPCRGHRDI